MNNTNMAQHQRMTEAAKSYKFPGEYMYKGVTYVDGISLSSIEKIEEGLELNSQDIIIACFPKSGKLRYYNSLRYEYLKNYVYVYIYICISYHSTTEKRRWLFELHSQWLKKHPQFINQLSF